MKNLRVLWYYTASLDLGPHHANFAAYDSWPGSPELESCQFKSMACLTVQPPAFMTFLSVSLLQRNFTASASLHLPAPARLAAPTLPRGQRITPILT